LDLVRWCWLPDKLLDELIRKANCPVLCVPASQTLNEAPLINPSGPSEANLLTTDVELKLRRLSIFEP
jgi:hypothetical protein